MRFRSPSPAEWRDYTRLALVGLVIGAVLGWSPIGRSEGLLDFLFGHARRAEEQRVAAERAQAEAARLAAAEQERRAKLRKAIAHKRTKEAAAPQQRLVCVRLCDGARLPLAVLPASDSKATSRYEFACTAAGHGAATKVVSEKLTQPGGKGTLVASASVELLQDLARPRANACPVESRAEPFALRFADDPTLKRGDLVATEQGLKRFIGAGQPPYRDADFVLVRPGKGEPKDVQNAVKAVRKQI